MMLFQIVAALYLIFVLTVLILWVIQKEQKKEITHFIKFTVIIPIRNEVLNIGKLLLDINKQSYPIGNYEVIIVDDHSSDGSLKKVQELQKTLKCKILIIQLPENKQGKKEAVLHGIEASEHETVITTDGDCRVGKNWLKSFNDNYDKNTFLVFGVVKFTPLKNLFDKCQALELAALVATGAAMSYLRLPGMCNGANFSFKKNVFRKVGGYEGNEKLPTGDDEFLLRKVRKLYPSSIRFMKNNDGVVSTVPQKSWAGLVNQKMRWASKWRYHTDLTTKITGGFIFGSNIAFFLMLTFPYLINISTIYMVSTFIIKIAVEFILAALVLQTKNLMKYIIPSLILSFVYPVYTIVIAALSLGGKYKWKDRVY